MIQKYIYHLFIYLLRPRETEYFRWFRDHRVHGGQAGAVLCPLFNFNRRLSTSKLTEKKASASVFYKLEIISLTCLRICRNVSFRNRFVNASPALARNQY